MDTEFLFFKSNFVELNQIQPTKHDCELSLEVKKRNYYQFKLQLSSSYHDSLKQQQKISEMNINVAILVTT